MLSRLNQHTLAFIMSEPLACRNKFEGTDNYKRLEEEFAHLSEGVS